jgi:hypothetical protein
MHKEIRTAAALLRKNFSCTWNTVVVRKGFLPLLGIEPRLSSPYPVALLTELLSQINLNLIALQVKSEETLRM